MNYISCQYCDSGIEEKRSKKDKNFTVQLVQLYLKGNTSVPEKEDQHVSSTSGKNEMKLYKMCIQ